MNMTNLLNRGYRCIKSSSIHAGSLASFHEKCLEIIEILVVRATLTPEDTHQPMSFGASCLNAAPKYVIPDNDTDDPLKSG